MQQQRHGAQKESDIDERQKTMKSVQNNYWKEKFSGDFKDDWSSHLRDFEAMCQGYDLTNEDCVYFLRFSLEVDVRQFYNNICDQVQRWPEISNTMSNRYALEERQDEVSNLLLHLTIPDIIENERDEPIAFDKFIDSINKLAPMERRNDRDK